MDWGITPELSRCARQNTNPDATTKRSRLERIVSLPRECCYADDGSPIKCPECGHAEFTEKMRDFIDFGVGAGPATEIEYFCGACGESVAYWAYGSFDPAYWDHKQANAQ